ncbi:MAG: hypothetical protein JSV81_01130, partial [Anaerolineales bacterium]
MTLAVRLLGQVQIRRDDQPITMRGYKPLALLAYLLVAGKAHTRQHLVDLLFDGPDDPKASLRWTLSELRRAIGADYILADRQEIAFNFEADYWLDVTAFEAGQIDLYRGEFLEGLTARDAFGLEQWVLFERERLKELYQEALIRQLEISAGRADDQAVIEMAHQLLLLDNLREEWYRALMQGYANLGQRDAALAQYDLCRQVLQTELGLTPAAETVALYQRIRRGELARAEDPTPLAAPAQARQSPPLVAKRTLPRHNLPPQAAPFVGRQTELAELTRWLADPEVRLVTILGPGGMGKTRLAIQAALAQLDVFAHGVRYAHLAPVDPTIFAGAIEPLVAVLADTLDFAFRGGDPPRDQLGAFLQDKHVLLILDDFEHLLETADWVSGLLSQAPRLKVLVTSRQRLNLREEWVFPLSGMRVPAAVGSRASEMVVRPGQAMETSQELATSDVLQLFAQHARRVQPQFDPAAEAACVARICQLVDGVPLGIELAAAWLRLMPCQAIAQEIETSLDFLTTTLRNVPQRHRSLRAVFDQSWNLLSEAEQAVLKQLSVFRGGFQRQAAQVVTGASLPQLSSLVDQSLLQVTPSGRYQMHELTRQ